MPLFLTVCFHLFIFAFLAAFLTCLFIFIVNYINYDCTDITNSSYMPEETQVYIENTARQTPRWQLCDGT